MTKPGDRTIEVLSQLVASGYFAHMHDVALYNSTTVRFVISREGMELLVKDPRFASGILYGYHRDVGDDLIDFRSYRGAFGKDWKGSLQLVIDQTTLVGYGDMDRHNPYNDAVGAVGHAAEVIGYTLGRFWGRWRRRNA